MFSKILRFSKCVKKYTSFAQVRLCVSKNIQVLSFMGLDFGLAKIAPLWLYALLANRFNDQRINAPFVKHMLARAIKQYGTCFQH